MMRIRAILWPVTAVVAMLSSAQLWAEAGTSQTSRVRADFAARGGPDLDKQKFGVYNCPYFKMDRWFRDLPLLEELAVKSLRYEPAWGGHGVGIDMNSPQISGTPEKLVYNFTDFDRLTESLNRINVEPLYVMCYTPRPLQRKRNVWGDKPTDMDAWKRICRDYAAHWRSAGMKVPYYEIWNEPDNPPFFFRGTMQDYFEIYRYGALGIKEGDPDAKVGGPTVAALKHDDSWICAFLDFVTSENLPLDFLSYHNYGDPEPVIEKARACLQRHPRLRGIPMMMTEYNSFVPLTPDFEKGGRVETHHCAAELLSDFRALLEHRDVTRVYWAMFNDPDTDERLGLVSLDGRRKAGWNAFRIYMDMPTTRSVTDCDTTAVQAMASCDGRRAAIAAWNESDADVETTIALANVPSGASRMHVYRIDRKNASFVDNPDSETLKPVEERKAKSPADSWTGVIPANSVVYITLGEAASDFRPVSRQ